MDDPAPVLSCSAQCEDTTRDLCAADPTCAKADNLTAELKDRLDSCLESCKSSSKPASALDLCLQKCEQESMEGRSRDEANGIYESCAQRCPGCLKPEPVVDAAPIPVSSCADKCEEGARKACAADRTCAGTNSLTPKLVANLQICLDGCK